MWAAVWVGGWILIALAMGIWIGITMRLGLNGRSGRHAKKSQWGGSGVEFNDVKVKSVGPRYMRIHTPDAVSRAAMTKDNLRRLNESYAQAVADDEMAHHPLMEMKYRASASGPKWIGDEVSEDAAGKDAEGRL